MKTKPKMMLCALCFHIAVSLFAQAPVTKEVQLPPKGQSLQDFVETTTPLEREHITYGLGVGMFVSNPYNSDVIRKASSFFKRHDTFYTKLEEKIKTMPDSVTATKEAKDFRFKLLAYRIRSNMYHVLMESVLEKSTTGVPASLFDILVRRDIEMAGWTKKKLDIEAENLEFYEYAYEDFKMMLAKNTLPEAPNTNVHQYDLRITYTLEGEELNRIRIVGGNDYQVLQVLNDNNPEYKNLVSIDTELIMP